MIMFNICAGCLAPEIRLLLTTHILLSFDAVFLCHVSDYTDASITELPRDMYARDVND